MNKFIKTFFVQALLFSPFFVFAQGFGQAPVPLNISAPSDASSDILNIVNFVLGIIGTIVIAYLIFGIFRRITAGGNVDQIDESNSMMTGSLISIFAVGVSASLINIIMSAITGNLGNGGL